MTTAAKATATIEQVRKMGRKDALDAFAESADTATPDGGWDAWLINGIGADAVCRLFGEPVETEAGWSEAMQAKLCAYHEGAREAMREIDAADAAE